MKSFPSPSCPLPALIAALALTLPGIFTATRGHAEEIPSPLPLAAESREALRKFLAAPDQSPFTKQSEQWKKLYVQMAERLLLDDAKYRLPAKKKPERGYAYVKWLAKDLLREEWLPEKDAWPALQYLKDVNGEPTADWERLEYVRNGVRIRIDQEWDRVFIVACRVDAPVEGPTSAAEIAAMQRIYFHFPPRSLQGAREGWWNDEPVKPPRGLQEYHYQLSRQEPPDGLHVAQLRGPFPDQVELVYPLRIFGRTSSWKTVAPVLSDGRFYAIQVSYWEQGYDSRSTPIVGMPDLW